MYRSYADMRRSVDMYEPSPEDARRIAAFDAGVMDEWDGEDLSVPFDLAKAVEISPRVCTRPVIDAALKAANAGTPDGMKLLRELANHRANHEKLMCDELLAVCVSEGDAKLLGILAEFEKARVAAFPGALDVLMRSALRGETAGFYALWVLAQGPENKRFMYTTPGLVDIAVRGANDPATAYMACEVLYCLSFDIESAQDMARNPDILRIANAALKKRLGVV